MGEITGAELQSLFTNINGTFGLYATAGANNSITSLSALTQATISAVGGGTLPSVGQALGISAGNAGLYLYQNITGTPGIDNNRIVGTNLGSGTGVQQTLLDIIMYQGAYHAGAGCVYGADCAGDGNNAVVVQSYFNGPTGPNNTNRNYTAYSPRMLVVAGDGGSATTLTAPIGGATNSITVASTGFGATAFVAGDPITIYDNSGSWWSSSVSGVAGSTVTLTTSTPASFSANSGNVVNVYRGEMDAFNPSILITSNATTPFINVYLGVDITDQFIYGNAAVHAGLSVHNVASKHGDLVDAGVALSAAGESAGWNNGYFVENVVGGTNASPIASGGYIFGTQNNANFPWSVSNGISLVGPRITGNAWQFQSGVTGTAVDNYWTGAGALVASTSAGVSANGSAASPAFTAAGQTGLGVFFGTEVLDIAANSTQVAAFSGGASAASTMSVFGNGFQAQIFSRRTDFVASGNIGSYGFQGLDTTPANVNYALINGLITSDTAGAHAGTLQFQAANAGALVTALTLTGTAATFAVTLGIPQATWADNQTCTAGQISVDASYVYACTATNTVKRASLSSF